MNNKNLTIKETFVLAHQNHQKNNLKIAEKLYKKLLKINPNHFETIFLLGSLLVQTKNFTAAKQLLQKAVQIQPNNAAVLNNFVFEVGFELLFGSSLLLF
jgi:Tfp pilus assembly protein PilF